MQALLEQEADAYKRYPELRDRLLQAEAASRGSDPEDVQMELLRLRQQVTEAEARGWLLLFEVASRARSASAAARPLLVERLIERHRQAGDRHDASRAHLIAGLIEPAAPGEIARRGSIPGCLRISTDPPGADLRLARFEPRGLVLAAVDAGEFGKTPAVLTDLQPGSWLATIDHPGFAPVRYPFTLAPGQEWRAEIKLWREAEIGDGMVYVPAGPFVRGGDDGARGLSPRTTVEVGGFFIRRIPVTNAEYLEFLEAADVHVAESLVPRAQDGLDPWWRRGPDGRYRIPGTDASRVPSWRSYPRWPVMGVSYFAAAAYCRWAAERQGRDIRLPRESEWEKAARGVDSRIYPWGNEWHPSLTACRFTYERQRPAEAGSIAGDESPYGVRDMAGNADEWCEFDLDAADAGDAAAGRPLRGGAWTGSFAYHRVASRDVRPSSEPYGLNGFRYVIPAP